MIAAQECCSGNEILDLIDCIFRELNVQWVDLLDGSHVRVPVLCCVCSRNTHAVHVSGGRILLESDVMS